MFVRSILAVAALAGIAVAQRPMPPMAVPPMAACPPVACQSTAVHCYGPGSMQCGLPTNETMVRAEVVILRLHPEVLKAMELCEDGEQPQKCCLTKCQVRKVMEMAKEDGRCEVLSAPQIVSLDGQRSCVCMESADSAGMQFSMMPRVSLDHKFIQVAVTAEQKVVEKRCSGSSCAAKCDDNEACQRRTIHIHQMQTIATVPTGNSVMLELYRSEPNTDHVSVITNGPPSLTKVPYINRLFKSPCDDEACCICVIVTPTEMNNEMVRARPMPAMTPECVNQCQVVVPAPPMMPCPTARAIPYVPSQEQSEPEMVPPPMSSQLAKLMAKYEQACADGNMEKARKLARRCIDIDPTCFMRDE
jgi:hypothetical protein